MNVIAVGREPTWQQEGWRIPATVEEFASLYGDVYSPALQLIRAISPGTLFNWGLRDREPLPHIGHLVGAPHRAAGAPFTRPTVLQIMTGFYLAPRSYDPVQRAKQKDGVPSSWQANVEMWLRKVGDGASRRRLIRLLSADW
jgi:hypothetical protein